jgi:hypothetical protein
MDAKECRDAAADSGRRLLCCVIGAGQGSPKLSYGCTRHETTCKDGDDDQLAGRPGTEVAVGEVYSAASANHMHAPERCSHVNMAKTDVKVMGG